MKFLLRRVFNGSILLAAVSLLSFLLLQLAPGNYFDEMRLNPQISPETISILKAQYGVNEAFALRYLHWLRSAAHGEFGYSFAYNMPVGPLLLLRARNTLILAGASITLAWALALLLGGWGAARQGHWDDRVLAATSAAGITLPDVVIALALLLLALKTHIAPVGGMVSARAEESSGWTKTLDILKHMVLPVAALVISLLPVLLRHVRAALAEALSAPYIQAARAHGISRQRILWRHALPATAGPLISLMGVSIGTLVSASILVEILMSWPGLGPLMLEAIFARDAYIVIGVVLTSSLVLVGGNLLSDVLLVVVDPRIRKP